MSQHLCVERLPFPPKIRYERDLEHRLGCIDFLIELWSWTSSCQVGIDFVRPYCRFYPNQKAKTNFRSLTRHDLPHGFLVSDLDFRLSFPDGQKRLYTFEYHRVPRIADIMTELGRPSLRIAARCHFLGLQASSLQPGSFCL